MPHDARAIANLILDRFDSQRFSISNKKINKLLYFCHGHSLLWLGEPLVKNHFEAWVHGPVVKVVYDAFKSFEFKPIVGRAEAFDYVVGDSRPVSYENMQDVECDLVVRIVGQYCSFTAEQLEAFTHREGTPWSEVWNTPENERGFRSRIPDKITLEYFAKGVGENSTSH
jgi:uncharacterized phage-associated protein